jgi:uncharacterized membrane protein
MTDDSATLGFGLAFIAVLVAGFASSYATAFLIGSTLDLGPMSYLMISFVGAIALRLVLGAVGYEIPYLAAVFAFLVGSVIAVGLGHMAAATGATQLTLPVFGLMVGAPSLLLSAWIVRFSAFPGRGETAS